MARTLVIDIMEGHRLKEDKGVIVEITRPAIVYGLDVTLPPALGAKSHIYYQALSAPGMPSNGDPHPSFGGLIVRERNCRIVDPTIVQVEIIYRPRGGLEFEPPVNEPTVLDCRGVLEQVTNQKDLNGVPINVYHDGITFGAEVGVLEPRAELSFSRIITSPSPAFEVLQYTGAVNSTNWPPKIGGAPRTWLCTSIGVRLEDAQIFPSKWEFTYTFRKNWRGHDPGVYFVDPETQRPPPGLTVQPSFGDPPVGDPYWGAWAPESYPALDFNNLGLGY